MLIRVTKRVTKGEFMAFTRFVFVFLLACLLPLPCLAAESCPPSPAADDFVLPGPGGQCFAFRAVGIGEGGGFYAQKRFTIGDPDNGFKGSPVTMTLGGHFQKRDGGDWVYYMGKYEVTEAQYYAVMGLPKGADQSLLKSAYPMAKVSYLETQIFIDRLNAWLFANAMDKLPRQWGSPGFARLPTEAEWEFAARGGTAVRADVFAARHPYGDDTLAAYEWFAGPSSSHNKVQPAGKLKPNALGIHDMLGNVSELVQTPYYIEYFQGRSGGVTARGGHFFTSEKDIRASLRTEEPQYMGGAQKGMQPNAKATMGFRLLLGAPVLAGREALNLADEEWEDYRAGAGATLPAGLSTAPTQVQVDAKVGDAGQYLARVQQFVDGDKSVTAQVAKQDLGYLQAALADAGKIRMEADEKNARAFARVATFAGFQACQQITKLAIFDGILQSGPNPSIQQQRPIVEANIQDACSTYYEQVELLSALPEAGENKAFEWLPKYLAEEKHNKQQAEFVVLVQKHAKEFRKNKRGDMAAWRADFAAWAQANLAKK